MPNTTNNIRFNYEYRDSGNYHKEGSIVFKNTNNIEDLKKVETQMRDFLFDKEFFYPYKLSIPLIHFDTRNIKLDHDWYRFDSLEFTPEQNTDYRSFSDFLIDLKQFARQPEL